MTTDADGPWGDAWDDWAPQPGRCRCVSYGERCTSHVGPDRPFCDHCEDRHPHFTEEAHVTAVPIGGGPTL